MWVDGTKQAKTAPLTLSLAPGRHTVRLQNAELGVDQTALVQEYAPMRGERIVRVEVLGRRFLYAIEVFPLHVKKMRGTVFAARRLPSQR